MPYLKPTLLFVGGSHSDIPLIKAAKECGFYVVSTGNRPDDLGHQYSDLYASADYSSPDEIYKVAKSFAVDAICPSCNDFAALSSSYAAAELDLPGHDNPEIAKTLHHKDLWRAFATANRIPSPRALGISSTQDLIPFLSDYVFPLLVKPVDLTGGKGIELVRTLEEVQLSVERALDRSAAKRVVLEEYINGTKHGFTTIIRQEKVAFWFADDEQYHISPFLVSGASSPSSASHQSLTILKGYCETIARLLRLKDGIFHVQFIERSPGDPVIIEICRRPPGDLYVELVKYATGVPYARWIVEAFAGFDLDHVCSAAVTKPVARHCLMAHQSGIFTGFDVRVPSHISILDGLLWGIPGQMIKDPSKDKLGILLVENKSTEAAPTCLQDIFRCLTE